MVILAWLCVAVAPETEQASTEVVQPQVIESMVLVDDGEFWIDSHEVTNAEYARFVASTGHRVPSPVDTGLEQVDEDDAARGVRATSCRRDRLVGRQLILRLGGEAVTVRTRMRAGVSRAGRLPFSVGRGTDQ